MSRRLLSLFLAALVGLLGGTYAPVPATAIHTPRHMWFLPPTETDGNNSKLTTGWHDPGNISLDWGNYPSNVSWSRANAYSPDGAPMRRAYATPNDQDPYFACQWTVWVDVWDADNPGRWMASVGHVHTHTPQFAQIDYYFSNGIHFNGGTPVAQIAQSPDPGGTGCGWTGPYVHETHVMGSGGGGRPSPTRSASALPPHGCP